MRNIINIEFYSGKDLYSDGEIEDEMLEIVKSMNDENDLLQVIKRDNRWPILYHFSDMRKNLLEWYEFDDSKNLLEIGSGCGALTDVFCKSLKSVTCVESSFKRAQIAEQRLNNYNNVSILVGNFNEMHFDEKFDYITLIGVLEYAKMFSENKDNAVHEMLENISNLINVNGELILAIENKYGVKYFSGAREDHTGGFFDGIEDYIFTENDIVTYGKNEIQQILLNAGFRDISFYYPWPDYKLPTLLMTDDYMSNDFSDLQISFDNDRFILFDQKAFLSGLKKEKNIGYFANSFLIFAKKMEL